MARPKKQVYGGIEGEVKTVEEVRAEMKPVVKESTPEPKKEIKYQEWHYEAGVLKEIYRRAIPVLGETMWEHHSLAFPFTPLAELFPNMPDALVPEKIVPGSTQKFGIKTPFGTVYARRRRYNPEDFRATTKKGQIVKEFVGKIDQYFDVGIGDDYTVNYKQRRDGTIDPISGDVRDVPLQR